MQNQKRVTFNQNDSKEVKPSEQLSMKSKIYPKETIKSQQQSQTKIPSRGQQKENPKPNRQLEKNISKCKPMSQSSKIQTTRIQTSRIQRSKPKKQVIYVDGEGSSSENCDGYDDCQCKPRFPIYQSQIKQQNVRRRQRNHLPYYESNILQENRRINFFDTSTSSEEEIIVTREYIKVNQLQNQIPPPQYSLPYTQPTQYQQDPIPLAPTVNFSPIVNNQQRSQSPKKILKDSNKPVSKQNPQQIQPNKIQSPPQKGISSFQEPKVRNRYETPLIIHPQRLKLPSQKKEIIQPSKPLYRKPIDRPRRNKQSIKSKPSLSRIPLDTPQIKPKQPRQRIINQQKELSSSSDCLLECECLSDDCC